MPPVIELVALACLLWSVIVVVVQIIGVGAVFRYFNRRPGPSMSSKLGPDAPVVTIIRPVKDAEPHLYDCIASTFRQDYPVDKIAVRLCVEDEHDAAYPVLKKLVDDFPAFDVEVLLESRDPALHGPRSRKLGPNPKIRNISRAYREAKGDIVWIVDCNVWVSSGVLGRMVDKLMGFAPGQRPSTPYKFVHQVPFLIDVSAGDSGSPGLPVTRTTAAAEPLPPTESGLGPFYRNGGGRLDEMFLATSHVKFYSAISAVGIAPCVVGKSNMFRKSHLDLVTAPSPNVADGGHGRPTGIDYFSHHICEDHLIGDLLWRSKIAGHRNHGILWGDLAVQPMGGMSVSAYAARRIRWLRARKFTVPVATLVEPGIESIVCSAYISFALTTLPWFRTHLAIPPTWGAASVIWLACIAIWICVDRIVFAMLHSGKTIEADDKTPPFARGTSHAAGLPPRALGPWFSAWLARELLALPVWAWAVLFGTTVKWRGKAFKVRLDTSVVEVSTGQSTGHEGLPTRKPKRASKDRLD